MDTTTKSPLVHTLLIALQQLVNKCDTSELFDPNLEGPEHEALEQARTAIARVVGLEEEV